MPTPSPSWALSPLPSGAGQFSFSRTGAISFQKRSHFISEQELFLSEQGPLLSEQEPITSEQGVGSAVSLCAGTQWGVPESLVATR